MNNGSDSNTSIESENYTFCPLCGKILPNNAHNKQCTKCGVVKVKKEAVRRTTYNEEWEKYFPYLKIRPLQSEIIETISAKGKKNNHIIVQAANGVGKTIAVLSASLPISIEQKKTIAYCCRTHQQMSRVIDELKMIKQLKPVSGVALRGRKESCLHPIIQKFSLDAANAADICRHLKKEGKCKYFVNLSKKAKLDKLKSITHKQVLDSLELIDIGKSLEVCPYELTKRIISDVDVIVASYQHMFNPNIRENFLQNLDKELKDIILIVDEAHNLPSTAVDISSSTLSDFSIENAQNEALKYKMGEIYDLLEALSAVLNEESKDININDEIIISPSDFISKVEKRSMQKIDEKLILSLERLGDFVKEIQSKQNKTPMSYNSSVARYLHQLLETKNRDDYAHFMIKKEGKTGNLSIRMLTLSLDPRVVTEETFNGVQFSISLSGTLDPIEAYVSLIGLPEERVESLSLPSPYKDENHLTLVIDKLSSKMEDRVPANYLKMVEVIKAVVDATPKNVGVFCASYSVMRSILDSGLERSLSKPLYIPHQGISSSENDALISDFKNESKKSGAVLISVLGGRSSEGSDYPGSEMHSVVIIGIPYAKPSPTVKATIEYLETQFPTQGREFGYNLPALTRAAQAAGRPIRSLEDFAAIVLMDYRFARHYYKKHLPVWLKEDITVVQPEKNDIEKRITKFFEFHNL